MSFDATDPTWALVVAELNRLYPLAKLFGPCPPPEPVSEEQAFASVARVVATMLIELTAEREADLRAEIHERHERAMAAFRVAQRMCDLGISPPPEPRTPPPGPVLPTSPPPASSKNESTSTNWWLGLGAITFGVLAILIAKRRKKR